VTDQRVAADPDATVSSEFTELASGEQIKLAFDQLDRVERLPRVRALVIIVLEDQAAGGCAANMIGFLVQRRQGQLAAARRYVDSQGHLLATAGRSGWPGGFSSRLADG